jgi:hypothetical protein
MKTNLLDQKWRLDGAALHTTEIREARLSINVNSRGQDGGKILEISRETEMLAQISLDPAACDYLAWLLTTTCAQP